MTESEAIEAIQFDLKIGGEIHSQVLCNAVDVAIQALEELQQYRAIGTPEELQDMKSDYFEALSDWRQYRKIGTLEECRAAMEKQIAKKPTYEGDGYSDGQLVYDTWVCPCCGRSYELNYDDYDYCPNCGQNLDWSDLNKI